MDDRFRRIRDLMARGLHAERHFHILGRVGVSPAAELAYHARSEERERTWRDERRTEGRENESIEYGEAVFDMLHMLQHVLRLLHMYAGSYGGYLLILK